MRPGHRAGSRERSLMASRKAPSTELSVTWKEVSLENVLCGFGGEQQKTRVMTEARRDVDTNEVNSWVTCSCCGEVTVLCGASACVWCRGGGAECASSLRGCCATPPAHP